MKLLNVKAYINEENTRTFLGIECVDCNGVLARFVENINKFLAEYDLPSFYEVSNIYLHIYEIILYIYI